MHDDVRKRLREELESAYRRSDIDHDDLRAECHQGIGDWYMKLFRSSGDTRTFEEAVYHRLCAYHISDELWTKKGEDGTDVRAYESLRDTSCLELANSIRLAQEKVLSSAWSSSFVDELRELWDMHADMDSPVEKEVRSLLIDLLRERMDYDQVQSIIATRKKAELGLKYDQVISLIGLRRYRDADKVFKSALKELGSEFPSFNHVIEANTGFGISDARLKAHEFASECRGDQEKLTWMVKYLRRFIFLQLLYVQLDKLNECEDTNRVESGDISTANHDRKIYCESIYAYSTTVMRYIDDAAFLQKENSFLRTHYGILLAHMERYYEANRRFDEASGYLFRAGVKVGETKWAVIDLRRAEAMLLKAKARRRENEQDPLPMIYLKDVDNLLRRSRRKSLGKGQNIWWWSLMYELWLQTGVLSVEWGMLSTMPPQEGKDLLEKLRRRFESGVRLVKSDAFRLARLVHVYARCPELEASECQKFAYATKKLRRFSGESDGHINPDVLKYIKMVANQEYVNASQLRVNDTVCRKE